MQGVIISDVGQARTEDTQDENGCPALRADAGDFAQARAEAENLDRAEQPAEQHHVKHHARGGMTAEFAP